MSIDNKPHDAAAIWFISVVLLLDEPKTEESKGGAKEEKRLKGADRVVYIRLKEGKGCKTSYESDKF